MASDWYYKEDEQEQGPYTFRDLVEMVREERLTAEVLVRPHYTDEWQRADSVVGLFHMARRDPATLPPVNQTAGKLNDEYADAADLEDFISSSDEIINQEESIITEEVEKPSWLKRLLSLRSSKVPAVTLDPNREINIDLSQPAALDSGLDTIEESVNFESENQVESVEVDGAGIEESSHDEVSTGAFSDATWSSAIDAAVERIDARAPQPEEEVVQKQIIHPVTFSFLQSPVFRKMIQAGAIVLCVSLAIYWFVNWMGQGTLVFPLIGACSPLMFLVYSALSLVGIIVIGSLLLYVSSKYLRMSFKLGSVLVTANITAYILLNWSETNIVVFPTRNSLPTEDIISFPLVGECSSFAYWMYFADVIIFVAVITYFLAWWLETHAEDV